MKPQIIPKSITDAEKEIKEALKDPNIIGVFHIKKRKCGNTLLHRLIENTEDISHSETKQLNKLKSNGDTNNDNG